MDNKPDYDDIVVASRPIVDSCGKLLPSEEHHVMSAAPKRRREFRAGRTLARELLSGMGFGNVAIPASEHRYPVWPSGILGSISHTSDLVAVAVTDARDIQGIGLDIEVARCVKPALHSSILTPADTEKVRAHQDADATHWFSSKESIYKAVNPLCHEFIDYTDVSVNFRGETFTAICHLDCQSKTLIEKGIGRIWKSPGYVFTLFRIPGPALPTS